MLNKVRNVILSCTNQLRMFWDKMNQAPDMDSDTNRKHVNLLSKWDNIKYYASRAMHHIGHYLWLALLFFLARVYLYTINACSPYFSQMNEDASILFFCFFLAPMTMLYLLAAKNRALNGYPSHLRKRSKKPLPYGGFVYAPAAEQKTMKEELLSEYSDMVRHVKSFRVTKNMLYIALYVLFHAVYLSYYLILFARNATTKPILFIIFIFYMFFRVFHFTCELKMGISKERAHHYQVVGRYLTDGKPIDKAAHIGNAKTLNEMKEEFEHKDSLFYDIRVI